MPKGHKMIRFKGLSKTKQVTNKQIKQPLFHLNFAKIVNFIYFILGCHLIILKKILLTLK